MILFDFYKYCVRHKWELGLVLTPVEDILQNKQLKVKWIKNPYKDRWFADPFILRVSEKEIVLLVEEFYYPLNKGRISKIVISRDTFEIINVSVVLELKSHLSFPAIIRHGDEVFIYPESSADNNLSLYKYVERHNKCVKTKVLINKPLTDAVIHDFGGNRILFSTQYPEQNGKILRMYKPNLSGLYEEFSSFHFEENIARMAGDFFSVKGILYRPAQESNNDTYGHSISIQKVEYSESSIAFNEIIRISSPHKVHKLGFHTFNVYEGTVVVDVKGFRRPILGSICYFLKKLVRYK